MTSSRSTTVLIVDDESLYVDVHARMLGSRYDVKTAYSGQAALDAIDDTVDVLLIDRRMPRISGDEVIETLEHRGFDCRKVMISAVDPDDDPVDVEIDDYLTKPVSERELEECIERVLES